MTTSATDAVTRLREGNQRFVEGKPPEIARDGRRNLTEAHPFAIVLGCSDSRVPIETIFSQDIGDLFVIRVAGHVVAKSQIGSVEFALETYSPSIVVVLGHSQCGAVMTTIKTIEKGSVKLSPHLQKLVDLIRPSVEAAEGAADHLDAVIRENVRASMRLLVERSELIGSLARSGELTIVGAHYSLESGAVDFLEGLS